MDISKRLLLTLILALPVIFLGLVALMPYPAELRQALEMVRLAEAQGKPADAARYLRVVVSYQPERSELWERIGQNEYQAENYSEAIRDFETAKRKGVLSDQGMIMLAEAYLLKDLPEDAIQVWRDLSAREGIDLSLYPELIRRQRTMGDWDGALRTAAKWFQVERRNRQAGYIYGLLLSIRGTPEEALETFLAVSRMRGPEGDLADQMMEALELALKQTDPAYVQVVIGQRLGSLGEWDLAEQAFLNGIDADPAYAEAWAFLAEARQNLGKDGSEAIRRAGELNPASDIVRITQALYWRRQNHPEIAISYLRALAEKYPQDGNWQVEIGATLAESGDLIEAMRTYQRAIEIEPENASLWRALVVFSASYGFDPESYTLPALDHVLALDPESVESLDTAGWVYLTLGDLEKAEHFLQQALQADGAYPAALLHIGQLYLETGRSNQALRALTRAAAQSTDLKVALIARRLLAAHFEGSP